MRKLCLALFLIPNFLLAQKLIGGKNIIKTNLTGDLIRNYNITYERALGLKTSFSLGLRYMPPTKLPGAIKDILEKQFDDKNLQLEKFEMGNFAITPELRFYLSAGKMKGFYVAPYARYSSFDLKVPVGYSYTSSGTTYNASATFTGKFTALSGGILLGSQFQIAKKLVLDVWFIGAHYGTSNGTIIASEFDPSVPNSPEAKDAFKTQVESVNGKDYGPFQFKGEVAPDYKSATFTSTGAWGGIRAAGFSLGLRF